MISFLLIRIYLIFEKSMAMTVSLGNKMHIIKSKSTWHWENPIYLFVATNSLG